MNNEKIWQGSTYETTITDKDLTAQTVTLTLKKPRDRSIGAGY